MASDHPIAQARAFAILGDSNIRNHITKTSCRANAQLKSAQVISCGHMGIFSESLSKVKSASAICIISCLTNFLASKKEGPSTVSSRIEPLIQDIREALFDACSQHPDRWYMVAPPMYRTNPTWYREGLPEVLTLFSQAFSGDRPGNFRLLPSFPTPDYEADGVHLTAFSGLEFVLHLFDSAQETLDTLDVSPETHSARSSEATRVLEDRVMVLEQDHRRLNRVVDGKIAIDAELADFHANERNEDCFVISGLPKIPDEVTGKPWQDQALRDVQAVLLLLMGKEMSIVFIKNSTSRGKDAEVTYTVKMSSVEESRSVRKKFGSFFLGGVNKRPDSLKHININNWTTPETKTRISILKLLASRYRTSNPGGKAQVIRYDPRPLIKITPPASATDRRVQVMNYIEAIKNLPCNFSSEEVSPIIRRLNPKLVGQVKALFTVIDDDQLREQLRKFDKKKSSHPDTTPAPTETSPADSPESVSKVVSQPSSEASGSRSGSRSRSGKRTAEPISGAPPKK